MGNISKVHFMPYMILKFGDGVAYILQEFGSTLITILAVARPAVALDALDNATH